MKCTDTKSKFNGYIHTLLYSSVGADLLTQTDIQPCARKGLLKLRQTTIYLILLLITLCREEKIEKFNAFISMLAVFFGRIEFLEFNTCCGFPYFLFLTRRKGQFSQSTHIFIHGGNASVVNLT